MVNVSREERKAQRKELPPIVGSALIEVGMKQLTSKGGFGLAFAAGGYDRF